ncbi:MAG: hypothetical protein K6E87_05950 [bacterium]|nr:hypothetical protein [bacterium]
MSAARKVLMIIAFVLSIGAVLTFALCAVAFFISINNEELLTKLLDGLNKQHISLDDGKLLVTIAGVVFAIFAFLALINACLSIKGVKSNRIGLMVINIIFGVISGIYINSLGAIFGLVDNKKE